MKNKWKLSMIFILVMVMLSGCSLAQKESGREESAGTNRLVGALITSEYLELEEERLFANIEKRESIDIMDWKFSFPNREGLLLLAPEWTDENGETIMSCICDEGIYDLHTGVNVKDDSSTTTLSANVYAAAREGDTSMCFYLNPIYQTENQEFYVVPGTCVSSVAANLDHGAAMSKTISEENKVTKGKNTEKQKVEIRVSMSCKYAPEKVFILQMNEENQVIEEFEYVPKDVPESIDAEESTAYFIVKTERTDKDGKKIVERTLYDREETIKLYYVSEENSKFLSKKSIEIK